MKKYLIVLAAAVFALASCTPTQQEEGNEYTKISFKKAEVELALGASDKLTLLWEPTSLEAPKATWASSNAEVVSVNNGIIEALAIGEANITAKVGDLEAVCKVTVKDPLDMIQWGGWSIWKLNKEDFQSPDTFDVAISIGTVRCRIITADFQIWDDGFIQTTDADGEFTGLSGAGYRMYIENVPVYIIAEGTYKGYYISFSTLQIVDPAIYNPADTAFIYCAPAGKQGDAQKFYTYLTDTTAAIDYAECFTGVEVDYADYDNQKAYYWQGLAGTGVYGGDEWQAYYMCNINWMGGVYGLALNEDETDVKQPAEWAPITEKYYEFLPASNNVRGLGTPKRFVEKNDPMRNLPTNVLIHK